jgi:hypothetical protein
MQRMSHKILRFIQVSGALVASTFVLYMTATAAGADVVKTTTGSTLVNVPAPVYRAAPTQNVLAAEFESGGAFVVGTAGASVVVLDLGIIVYVSLSSAASERRRRRSDEIDEAVEELRSKAYFKAVPLALLADNEDAPDRVSDKTPKPLVRERRGVLDEYPGDPDADWDRRERAKVLTRALPLRLDTARDELNQSIKHRDLAFTATYISAIWSVVAVTYVILQATITQNTSFTPAAAAAALSTILAASVFALYRTASKNVREAQHHVAAQQMIEAIEDPALRDEARMLWAVGRTAAPGSRDRSPRTRRSLPKSKPPGGDNGSSLTSRDRTN